MKEPEIIIPDEKKLSWSKLDVSQKLIKPTPKLFYNKYAFKVDLILSGAELYRTAGRFHDYKAFANYVETQKHNHTYRSAWINRTIQDANPKKLYSIFEFTKKYGKSIRARGEGTHLSICSETEEILFTIIKDAKLSNFVHTLFRPVNEEATQKLNEDTIFVGNPKFKFRVMIRGAVYKPDVKKQILNYFENYKDSIIVTPGVIYLLGQDRQSYIQGYFHVDNTDVLLFLKMIHPKFIGKIFTLEAHETK